MNNIIFAKTRHHYKTYDDLYNMAQMSGYPVRYIDDIDWRDSTRKVIAPVKSTEWDAIPRDKRARLIWWNLERGVPDAPQMDMANPYAPPYVDEVWASDAAYARHIGAKYVFLGGNRAFGCVDFVHKQYDVVTLMYYSGRRQRLKSELSGMRCADIDGGLWGDERHQRLAKSRLMVSAHQDDQPWSEPIRFMLAACYALPVLSETCADSGYWKANTHYLSAALEELAIGARSLLAPMMKQGLNSVGANAWRLVCVERPFRQEVEAAL